MTVSTIDTHGKMNAEFRNEVNGALARHESSFDQINLALQEVLTELQTLRTSYNQNSNSSEINPFVPEGPSHPPTSHHLSPTISLHITLNSHFPALTETTPLVGCIR